MPRDDAGGAPGAVAGLLLGWGPVGATALAGVTYISSSGVIAKVLTDLGRLGNRETPVILGILGSLIGSWAYTAISGNSTTSGIDWIAFFLGVVAAAVLIVVYGMVVGRKQA